MSLLNSSLKGTNPQDPDFFNELWFPSPLLANNSELNFSVINFSSSDSAD